MIDNTNFKYDGIFNLFTSFGYVDHDYNIKTIKNIERQLKDDGVIIIDFMNTSFVKKNLVQEEIKIIDNLEFEIKRRVLSCSFEKVSYLFFGNLIISQLFINPAS